MYTTLLWSSNSILCRNWKITNQKILGSINERGSSSSSSENRKVWARRKTCMRSFNDKKMSINFRFSFSRSAHARRSSIGGDENALMLAMTTTTTITYKIKMDLEREGSKGESFLIEFSECYNFWHLFEFRSSLWHAVELCEIGMGHAISIFRDCTHVCSVRCADSCDGNYLTSNLRTDNFWRRQRLACEREKGEWGENKKWCKVEQEKRT